MAGRRVKRRPALFAFDLPYRTRYGLIAGVDEVGRGPLAGPVVSAAVILPLDLRIPKLNDSKKLSADQRLALYRLIQRGALAIGVGIVAHDDIDRLNIRQASFVAMRQALAALAMSPFHVLVDGFLIPDGPASQTGIIDGDARSAHIAAASIVAKVTRDHLMEYWHRRFPDYGFHQHKGYGTPKHLSALKRWGPCPIHRHSFAPVREHANT